MCIPHFPFHPPIHGHFGCFHLLAIVNNAATNIGVQVSEAVLPFLLYVYLKGALLNHMVILFNFLRNRQTFPQLLHHFIFPSAIYKCSNFSTNTYFVFSIMATFRNRDTKVENKLWTPRGESGAGGDELGDWD